MNVDDITITFLGSGTSSGIPVIACDCEVCHSDDPKDTRTNSSIMITYQDRNVLIDCGRDFRYQALRENIKTLEGVLITHTHGDHTQGLDEIRLFKKFRERPCPVYGRPDHLDYLKEYPFHYLFDPNAQVGGGLAKLDMIGVEKPFTVNGILFEPLEVLHGRLKIYGYKFLNCAYISDVSHIPETTMEKLHGLDLLVIDALRVRPHSTHFNLSQALEIVNAIKPKKTLFTHICHEIGHEWTRETLKNPDSEFYTPLDVEPAYDGLRLA